MAKHKQHNENPNTVLIVDDDEFYRIELEMELTEHGYDIWLSTDKPSLVFSRLAESPPSDWPDLALLDIRLKNDQDGFSIAREIAGKQIPFIYLTGYPDEDQFQKAVKTLPSAYLLKPVSGLDLHHAIQLAIEKASKLTHKLATENPPENKDFMWLKNKENTLQKVAVSDIFLVESYGNLVLFHTVRQRFHLRATLKEMEKLLAPNNFFRVHRRYLIALDHLEKKLPVGENIIIKSKKVPTGRQYRKALRDFLEKH